MGPLLVIFLVALILGALFIPIAAALFIYRRKSGGSAQQIDGINARAVPLLIGSWIFTAIVWLVGQGLYCETVRRVDGGFGDSWQVPVRNEYYFCMTDSQEVGYLKKHECGGLPEVSEINQLAEVGTLIVGTIAKFGAFSLDTQSGVVKGYRDIQELTAEISAVPTLKSAHEFYSERRGIWQDIVALILLAVLLAAVTALWCRAFIRVKPSGIAS